MVAREPGDGLSSNQVQPAVAYVSETKLAVHDRQGSAGRAHSIEFRVFNRVSLNVFVSALESFDQRILGIAAESVVVDMADCFHGESAGFLPTFVSAHTVGNNGEAALAAELGIGVWLPIKIGVLIV